LADEMDPWQAASGAKATALEAAAIDDAPSGDDISQRAVFGDDEEQDEEVALRPGTFDFNSKKLETHMASNYSDIATSHEAIELFYFPILA
jgi:hypothetical protein